MNVQADTEGATPAPDAEDQVIDQETPTEGGETPPEAAETEPEQLVVSIGDDPPPSDEDTNSAPEWVRELRKENREKAKRIRELEEAAAKRETQSQATDDKKPTLADCEYDEEAFEQKLTEWTAKNAAKKEAQAKEEAAQRAAQEQYAAKYRGYEEGKAKLQVSDFEEAEDVVKTTLNVTQQGIIVHAADNPTLVAYALGKNPAKAKELAAISDPILFAKALVKLEAQVKTTTRKPAPPAETSVRGSSPASLGADAELGRLEAEADRTGDRSKVVAYHRQQKQKAA